MIQTTLIKYRQTDDTWQWKARIKLVEEGVELYKSCKKRMGSIEVKINKLTESMKEESLED